jgi:hypothetical protein
MSELSKTRIPIFTFPATRSLARSIASPSVPPAFPVRFCCGFIDGGRRREGRREPITSSVRATEQRVVVESGTLELTVHRWRQCGNRDGGAHFMGGREGAPLDGGSERNQERSIAVARSSPIRSSGASAHVSESRRDHQSSSLTRRCRLRATSRWPSSTGSPRSKKAAAAAASVFFVFLLSTPFTPDLEPTR